MFIRFIHQIKEHSYNNNLTEGKGHRIWFPNCTKVPQQDTMNSTGVPWDTLKFKEKEYDI